MSDFAKAMSMLGGKKEILSCIPGGFPEDADQQADPEKEVVEKAAIKKADNAAQAPTKTAEAQLVEPNAVASDAQPSLSDVLDGCLLAEFAVDRAKVVKMPTNTAILTGISVASAIVGFGWRTTWPNGENIPAGLYSVIEQPPATGKSSLIGSFVKPAIIEMDKIRKLIPSLSMFQGDVTPEALDSSLVASGGLFALASGEQTLIDTLLGLNQQSKKLSNNGIILNGYSGDHHSSARVTRNGFHGSVHGGITLLSQYGAIDKVVEASNGTGLAERFLFLSEKSLLGKRDHSTWHIPDEQLSKAYAHACHTVMARARDRVQYRINDAKRAAVEELSGREMDDEQKQEFIAQAIQDAATLAPLEELEVIHVTAAGWERIGKWKNELELLMAEGEVYGSSLMQGVAGKMDQRLVKVALTLHVMEALMSGCDPSPNIEARFIDMAYKITMRSLKAVSNIAKRSAAVGDPARDAAILDYLISVQRKDGMESLMTNENDIIRKVQRRALFMPNGKSDNNFIRDHLHSMIARDLVEKSSVMARNGKTYPGWRAI